MYLLIGCQQNSGLDRRIHAAITTEHLHSEATDDIDQEASKKDMFVFLFKILVMYSDKNEQVK